MEAVGSGEQPAPAGVSFFWRQTHLGESAQHDAVSRNPCSDLVLDEAVEVPLACQDAGLVLALAQAFDRAVDDGLGRKAES